MIGPLGLSESPGTKRAETLIESFLFGQLLFLTDGI
jgi:hypothetical protein